MKRTLMVFLTVLLFSATGVYAELHDRGGGMIYDDVLNITWLQDANYAQTSGYDADGRMTWAETMEWVEQLTYGGFDDWKLPQTLPINGSEYDFIGFNPNGSKDRGYNVSAPGSVYSGSTASQMAYMYYNSLDNLARVDINGSYPQPNWGLKNSAPFINIQSIQSIGYWSSTDCSFTPETAFTFDFSDGWQFNYYKEYSTLYAWPVRDGDVMPLVEYDIIGREYFPGITIGTTTFGAMFAGKVVNDEDVIVGQFNVSLDHQGGPIEACRATNTLVRFRLTMKFFDGRRLVLVMPQGETAEANWIWDDVDCPNGGRGCEIHSLENLELDKCEDVGDPNVSLIAEVGTITLNKRKFGSRGFDEISRGILYGMLIHTPPFFPAVIGTFVGN